MLGNCFADLLHLFVALLLHLHRLLHLLTFVEALLFRCCELPLVLPHLCLTALSHLQSTAGFSCG
jgi:hypothetical protein